MEWDALLDMAAGDFDDFQTIAREVEGFLGNLGDLEDETQRQKALEYMKRRVYDGLYDEHLRIARRALRRAARRAPREHISLERLDTIFAGIQEAQGFVRETRDMLHPIAQRVRKRSLTLLTREQDLIYLRRSLREMGENAAGARIVLERLAGVSMDSHGPLDRGDTATSSSAVGPDTLAARRREGKSRESSRSESSVELQSQGRREYSRNSRASGCSERRGRSRSRRQRDFYDDPGFSHAGSTAQREWQHEMAESHHHSEEPPLGFVPHGPEVYHPQQPGDRVDEPFLEAQGPFPRIPIRSNLPPNEPLPFPQMIRHLSRLSPNQSGGQNQHGRRQSTRYRSSNPEPRDDHGHQKSRDRRDKGKEREHDRNKEKTGLMPKILGKLISPYPNDHHQSQANAWSSKRSHSKSITKAQKPSSSETRPHAFFKKPQSSKSQKEYPPSSSRTKPHHKSSSKTRGKKENETKRRTTWNSHERGNILPADTTHFEELRRVDPRLVAQAQEWIGDSGGLQRQREENVDPLQHPDVLFFEVSSEEERLTRRRRRRKSRD